MPNKYGRAEGGDGRYLKGMPDQVAAAKRDIMGNLPIMQAYPVEKRFFGSLVLSSVAKERLSKPCAAITELALHSGTKRKSLSLEIRRNVVTMPGEPSGPL